MKRWLAGLLLILSTTVWAVPPPKVTIDFTVSAANSVMIAPGVVEMTADAWTKQQNHPIVKVEFYQGSTLIGTSTTSPYTTTWSNVPAGTYALIARAISDKGDTADSPPVSVSIDAPPTVSLTAPASNAAYSAPAAVTLTATAADSDGTVTKVDYYQNGQLIGTSTNAPYSLTWADAPAGSYTITAIATDNVGASTTSAPVAVNVYNPPSVALTSPLSNALQNAPASFILNANASADSGRSLTQVEFYQGVTLIGSATSAPYAYIWNNVPAGSYSLTARATDDLGAITTSAPVTVTANAPPSVGITAPANNAAYTAPATVTLTASATDSDGSIAKVEFFDGAALLATVTSTPYSYEWTGVAADNHTLTAVATDNHGASTTSTPVTMGVFNPPTVSLTTPANNSVVPAPASVTLTASAAADSGRTLSKVEFFEGANLLGTVTAAPYTFNWNNVSAGSYSLTAKATDDLGATTTSAPVTVIANAAPQVSFTAPADNTSVIAPAAITLTANATDSDGSITQVEFFEGANLLATVTAAPYTYDWNVTQPGSYTLFAKTSDNNGASATATAVNITVAANQAPTITITAPTPNTSYTAPATIHLVANAADSDGSIAKVEFYNGAILLVTLTSAPYTYDWSNVQPGSYSITAVATDDRNLSTSTPLQIEVITGIPQAYYIHTDQLNTPRLITDQSNTVVWRWDSDPFGNTATNEDPNGTGKRFTYNQRFPGQYFDSETGLNYNYWRDGYDAGTGRFTQPDPIGLAGGSFSVYSYVNGNPLSHTDSTGLFLDEVAMQAALNGVATTTGVAVSAVASAVAGVAALAYPTSAGEGSDKPPKAKECDSSDDCAKLVERIIIAKNGIARRFRQLAENVGGIDQATHWEQLRGRQRNLRKLLNEAATKGCQVPWDAWYWASK